MTDPAYVVASFAIAIGGLIAYASSIARRARATRRTAQLLDRERERALPGKADGSSARVTGRTSETP